MRDGGIDIITSAPTDCRTAFHGEQIGTYTVPSSRTTQHSFFVAAPLWTIDLATPEAS